MRNYDRPPDGKRMIVILRPEDYDASLDAPTDQKHGIHAPAFAEDIATLV
jgi:hypothetical protein